MWWCERGQLWGNYTVSLRHSQQCLLHRTLTREQVLTAVGIFHTQHGWDSTSCSKILWHTGILLHSHLSATAALLCCLHRPSTHLLAQGECLLIAPESLCVACLQVVMSSEAELSDLIWHFKSITFIYHINYTQLSQHGGNVVCNILIRFFSNKQTKSCNILQGKKRYVSKHF